jgi:glutamate dehydrogenase
MLLSQATKLVAGFDHRDIFIDPDPDPETSFAERARLFALPRSSWADYDKTLISKGGGVFSRKAKSIPLSPEMQALTGLSVKAATPQDLIRTLLKADADLLFFGGIGTFIKASSESHSDAGDRANDALRVDGRDIRCKVIGEGANLGCTQLGRIEFAHRGGRINTDAIDNSAGVDTSDHEVNIKILLDAERRAGRLTAEERHTLLQNMQDDVAALVLETNYAQTRALSISEASAVQDLPRQARVVDSLEKAGLLDRQLERLPDRETFRSLESKGQGLTRPELAVLLAYAKLTLFEDILASDVPDDPYFVRELTAYFPRALQERAAGAIAQHRLRREIIATRLANALVNMTGPTFAETLSEETERPESEVMRAFIVVRAVHGADRLCAAIDALDNRIPAALQTALQLRLKQHLQRQSVWLLKHGPRPLAIEDAVQRYTDGARLIASDLFAHASPALRARAEAEEGDFIARGIPKDLAHEIAMLELLSATGDVVAVAEASGCPTAEAGRAVFTVGEALALDKLDILIREMKMDAYWDTLARIRLADEIAGHQRRMAIQALKATAAEACSGEAAVLAWLEHRQGIELIAKMIGEFQQSGLSIGKLAVLETTLRAFNGA